MKERFEIRPYANSKYNSATKNMLLRLQNTFASAINKNKVLPKYILIVLDDDLITFLSYKKAGVSELLGDWLKWLSEKFSKLIENKKKVLPIKCQKENEPCVYWSVAPQHAGMSENCNEMRRKLNFCLETLLKGRSDMRVIKLKNNWPYNDKTTVIHDRFTESGLYSYWEAIDSAVKFNVERHEVYLAKLKLSSQQMKNQQNMLGGVKEYTTEDARWKIKNATEESKEPTATSVRRDQSDMKNFFKKRKNFDKFHWKCKSAQGKPGNRFVLPRPPKH